MLLGGVSGRRFLGAKIHGFSIKTIWSARKFFMKNTARKLLCSRVFCLLCALSPRFWRGYFLGATIPGVDKYLIPIILAIIVLSAMPTLVHIIKNREYFIKRG